MSVLLALGCVVPLALGWPLLRHLGWSTRREAALSVCHAWTLGCLVLGFVLWGEVVVIGYSRWLILATGLSLTAAAWFLPPNREEDSVDGARVEPGGWGWLPVGVAALSVGALIVAGANDPALFGDEVNNWGVRAHALMLLPDLSPESVLRLQRVGRHNDYPMWNPMLQLWMDAVAGRMSIVANRFVVQGFAVLLPVLVFGVLSRFVRPLWAGLIGLWVALHPLVDTMAVYAESDIMLAFTVVAAFDAFDRSRVCAGDAAFRVGCVSAAAVGWSKNEGLMLLVVMAIAFGIAWIVESVVRRRLSRMRWRRSVWLFVPVVVVGCQRWWNAALGFHNDLFGVGMARETEGLDWAERLMSLGPDRLPRIAAHFAGDLCHPTTGLMLLPVAVAVSVVALTTNRGLWRHPTWLPGTLFLIGSWSAYGLIYMITPHELHWHMVTSAGRIVWHPLPLCAVVGGVALGALQEGRRQTFDSRSVTNSASVIRTGGPSTEM